MQPSPKRASAARRPWNALAPTGEFGAFVARVVAIIEEARSRVVRTVNSEMVLSYWHIGREIVEYVQRGEPRAEYGEQVIEDLSAQLLARVGRGYSTRNLWYFRDFYLTYRERSPSIRAEEFRTSLVQNPKPIDAAKILHEAGAEFTRGFASRLSWTYYRALLKVSDPAARAFFFKTVRNKMRGAAHGHTAAEIVAMRADATRPNMGLTTWTGEVPRKADVVVAKNDLGTEELEALNRIVTAYLEFAELQAMNRKPMYMADWIAKLDDFLKLSDRAARLLGRDL